MSIELPGLIYPEVLGPVLNNDIFRSSRWQYEWSQWLRWNDLFRIQFLPAMALNLMLNHMLESHWSSLFILSNFIFSRPTFLTWSPVQSCNVIRRCGLWQAYELRLAKHSPSRDPSRNGICLRVSNWFAWLRFWIFFGNPFEFMLAWVVDLSK